MESPTTAAPPDADDSVKKPEEEDVAPRSGGDEDDGNTTTVTDASVTEETTKTPYLSNRESKKLNDENADEDTMTTTTVIPQPTTSEEKPAVEQTLENPETTTPSSESPDENGTKQPDLEERRERVPETVLVGGRNYSDVQDNHPVVNDVETTPEDNKKVRRAATWFVWFLDRERIAKNLVSDVSDFASSRNIIYVVTALLLISSMLSLMGLYCTLRPKK